MPACFLENMKLNLIQIQNRRGMYWWVSVPVHGAVGPVDQAFHPPSFHLLTLVRESI